MRKGRRGGSRKGAIVYSSPQGTREARGIEGRED